MKDLGQLLAMGDPESQRELYQALSMQNALLSSMGMNVMDHDDDFVTSQYTFSGISDVYEMFMLDVSGSAETAVTKLYGRSPAGLNSTGESDLTNYYDRIKQDQESDLRPILEKLLPVMAVSTWGMVPDDLDIEFEPIRDSDQSERADLMMKYTQAIVMAYNATLISRRTALLELKQIGSFTGAYTNIRDEEIAQAEAPAAPENMLEGFPALPQAMPSGPRDGNGRAGRWGRVRQF